MANEALQWTILILLLFLVMGAFRQVSLLMPTQVRAAHSGPSIGKRMPRDLMERIRASTNKALDDGAVLAFITENCLGCQQLLADIDESTRNLDDQELVLIAKKPSAPFLEALLETGLPVLPDDGGEFWDSCNITATPLLVQIDSEGRTTAKEVTHHADAFASTA